MAHSSSYYYSDVYTLCLRRAAKVVNWIWLQFFVLGYMSEATNAAKISLGVILFDGSEAILGRVHRRLMRKAEVQRVGTKHAIFDRYHLKNLSTFAFACCESCAIMGVAALLARGTLCACKSLTHGNLSILVADSAIFKKSLFVQITGWSEFGSFYFTNLVMYIVAVVWPMSNTMNNLLEERDSKLLNKVFLQSKDVLNHRGVVCYRAYLKNRANTTATFQYAGFIVFMTVLPYNSSVFVRFSEGAGFDSRQQMLFVVVAWILCDTIIILL